MASLLRQIVAGPRLRHPEAGLDLCYVTDYIVATSGPSSAYPQRAYRNPTEDLVKWLDAQHGNKWAIWEFRAEGTGYSDEEVHNRIRHYPWPDHHPPPFALIPNIMASMRDWLKGPDSEQGRVVVVHCKAGKGRSGTVATSYLISEELWSVEDAMQRFTARRMRNGFGPGISIPSQVRWIGYVDWWAKHGKTYVERQIEIVEVHVWGLKDGVKVAIDGYVDDGKAIKNFHTFSGHERINMDGATPDKLIPDTPLTETPISSEKDLRFERNDTAKTSLSSPSTPSSASSNLQNSSSGHESSAAVAALFRPAKPIVLPTSDVNIDFERRNKAKYGLTTVIAVAHVWFNAFFESLYALQKVASQSPSDLAGVHAESVDPLNPPSNGVFSIHWDAMDGLKGSSRKGVRAFDQLSVVWRAVPSSDPADETEKIITEPVEGKTIAQTGPSDKDASSRLLHTDKLELRRTLGLKTATSSKDASRSSSPVSAEPREVEDHDSETGIQPYIPEKQLSTEREVSQTKSETLSPENVPHKSEPERG